MGSIPILTLCLAAYSVISTVDLIKLSRRTLIGVLVTGYSDSAGEATISKQGGSSKVAAKSILFFA